MSGRTILVASLWIRAGAVARVRGVRAARRRDSGQARRADRARHSRRGPAANAAEPFEVHVVSFPIRASARGLPRGSRPRRARRAPRYDLHAHDLRRGRGRRALLTRFRRRGSARYDGGTTTRNEACSDQSQCAVSVSSGCEIRHGLLLRLAHAARAAALRPALKGFAVDKGLAGEAPGSEPAYVAIGHLWFDSVEDFQGAFGSNADTILTTFRTTRRSSPSSRSAKS